MSQIDRIEIRKWLLDRGLTQTTIAKDLKVSNALVCLTIKGERKNPAIIGYLRRKGCPNRFLPREAIQ